jgi:hypothetical protein
MVMTTPDVEADMIAKLAALLPSDIVASGASQNARAGPLRPTSNAAGAEVFVQLFAGASQLDNDGRIRFFGLQVTTRSAKNAYSAGFALALRIHDALDLLGPFTGASGAKYMDVRAQLSCANHLGADDQDAELFAEAFDVWCETLHA